MTKQYKVTLPDGEMKFYDTKPKLVIKVDNDDFEFDVDFYDADDVVIEKIHGDVKIAENIILEKISIDYFVFLNTKTHIYLKVCGIEKFTDYGQTKLGTMFFISDEKCPIYLSEVLEDLAKQNQI